MDYIEINERFRRGDHISDDEMFRLYDVYKHLLDSLDKLCYPAYSLVQNDFIQKVNDLRYYLKNRGVIK